MIARLEGCLEALEEPHVLLAHVDVHEAPDALVVEEPIADAGMAALEVFGVSAQGGPLAERDELLAKGEICDRVYARDRSGLEVSLIAPVRWAIFGE